MLFDIYPSNIEIKFKRSYYFRVCLISIKYWQQSSGKTVEFEGRSVKEFGSSSGCVNNYFCVLGRVSSTGSLLPFLDY